MSSSEEKKRVRLSAAVLSCVVVMILSLATAILSVRWYIRNELVSAARESVNVGIAVLGLSSGTNHELEAQPSLKLFGSNELAALHFFVKATELDPGSSGNYFLIGKALSGIDCNRALFFLRRAATLEPGASGATNLINKLEAKGCRETS